MPYLCVLRSHLLRVHDLMSSGDLKNVLEEILVFAVSPVFHHRHAPRVVHRQDQPAQESRNLVCAKPEENTNSVTWSATNRNISTP